MKESYTFTFLGNGSYSNRGCEAIVRGTTAILRQEFGDCRFHSIYLDPGGNHADMLNERDPDILHHPVVRLMPYRPQRFSNAWFKKQYRNYILRKPDPPPPTIYQQIDPILRGNPSNAILLLGGDVATPGAGGDPEYVSNLIELAFKQNSPVIFWGASIGPFSHNPDFERKLADQLARLNLVCVRETITYDYLQSLGLRDNLRLVADPAFWMQPEPFAPSETLAALLKLPCLGVNFSPLIGRNYASAAEWKTRVKLSLEQIARIHHGPILLLPHVFRTHNDDAEFLRTVLQHISPENRKDMFLIDEAQNAAQSKWLIGQLELFAGARTHTTIAALSSLVPTLFIGYSAKSRGIARDAYDHLDWCVDGNRLDPDELASKILAMKEQTAALRHHLKQRLPVFQDRACQAAREVRAVLS